MSGDRASPDIPQLGPLGFGVTGPHATRLVARRDTIALIGAALDLGVTAFDTGPFYGDGEAEVRLGLALAGRPPEAAFVITKARTFDRDGDEPDDPAARVDASIRGSLKRLRRDRIDLLLLHGPPPHHITEAVLASIERWRARGAIGAIGVCGRGPMLDEALARGPFRFAMCPVGTDQTDRLVRFAAGGVSVLAIETMRGRKRPPPTRGGDLWYALRALRQRFSRAQSLEGCGIEAALALPAVACVVTSTTRRAHLEENAALAGVTRR